MKPEKVLVVSSAPQIRYPDCYGIDMSKLGDLLVFRAAKEILTRKNDLNFLEEIYKKCQAENQKPFTEIQNILQEFYARLDDEERAGYVHRDDDLVPQFEDNFVCGRE